MKKGALGKVETLGGYTRPNPSPVRGRLVALNESGTQRIGEGHQRARLTDAQVDQIRDAYEQGLEGEGPRVGYKTLAKRFGVSKRTVRGDSGKPRR